MYLVHGRSRITYLSVAIIAGITVMNEQPMNIAKIPMNTYKRLQSVEHLPSFASYPFDILMHEHAL